MAEKTLQKHEKAIIVVEGKLEQLQSTVEQFHRSVGETQVQTNSRIEDLGVQVVSLTSAAEEMKLGMGEMMRYLMKEKNPDLEDEDTTVTQDCFK